jgi:SAM-dependent methyltransferase
MHPAIFKVFDDTCRARGVCGAVLEIGATPDASTLLNLPALANAAERIGINMAPASTFGGFNILQCNANAMTCFSDARFDAVLCNAVLEHDPFFWKTLAEIRRVVKPNGLVAIGTPGYAVLRHEPKWRRWLSKIAWLSRNPDGWALQHSTLTLAVHNFPGDYYRFSEQAYRDVFFDGMTDVAIRTVLVPPRIIGVGIRV